MIVVQQRIVAARARDTREPADQSLPCGLQKTIRDNVPDSVEFCVATPLHEHLRLAANDTALAE